MSLKLWIIINHFGKNDFKVQVLVFGLLCYFGGLTKIGFEPVLELSEGTPTFLGTETIHKWVKPNIWIGPDEKYWISKHM